MKYLLLFAFLTVVWSVWSKRQASRNDDLSARHNPPPEKMVTCVHCGIHLPESEGIAEGGRVYCCEAHRAADQGARN